MQTVSITVADPPPAVINCKVCYGYSYSDDLFTTPLTAAGTYTATETLPSGCEREVILNITAVRNPLQDELDKINAKVEGIKQQLQTVRGRRP